jgi:hypothetical protein
LNEQTVTVTEDYSVGATIGRLLAYLALSIVVGGGFTFGAVTVLRLTGVLAALGL